MLSLSRCCRYGHCRCRCHRTHALPRTQACYKWGAAAVVGAFCGHFHCCCSYGHHCRCSRCHCCHSSPSGGMAHLVAWVPTPLLGSYYRVRGSCQSCHCLIPWRWAQWWSVGSAGMRNWGKQAMTNVVACISGRTLWASHFMGPPWCFSLPQSPLNNSSFSRCTAWANPPSNLYRTINHPYPFGKGERLWCDLAFEVS